MWLRDTLNNCLNQEIGQPVLLINFQWEATLFDRTESDLIQS